MKKLIVLSVVLALIAGSAFAVDLSGIVFGHAEVVKGDTGDDSEIESSAGMKRVRLEGSGANDDGTFGGWIRISGPDGNATATANANPSGDGKTFVTNTGGPGFEGIVWWKPIDQFKISIGGNSDGIWGKEGVTGWMFYQMASDTDTVVNQNNVWAGDNRYGQSFKFRNAFYNGFSDNRAFMTISPAEMVDINIAIPFFDGGETKDVFKHIDAQIDFKADFGNIAVTYRGNPTYLAFGKPWSGGGGIIYGYYGGSFGDLALDVGIGFQLANEDDTSNPLSFGVGAKYATDAFGLKARIGAAVGGEKTDNTNIVADIMPFFKINDSLSVFVSVGLGVDLPDGSDAVIGWHFNPYIQVGSEWGPAFYAGIVVESAGKVGGGDAVINWSVPIALQISF